MFACREPVGGHLCQGPSAPVQCGVCLYECVCVFVCLHTPYVGLRSIASVAPARPSPPQTINSVIAALRLMHGPKQSAKRKNGL